MGRKSCISSRQGAQNRQAVCYNQGMLTHVAIRNLALISQLELDVPSGFTVLTGETGAGKSMVMDGLSLALGARADAGLIRNGQDVCDVTATFAPAVNATLAGLLDEHGLELDENSQLALRRQIKREGASKAWVNGTPVNASVLAQLGDELVDYHGQHAQQALMHPASQRDMFDSLAGLMPQREKVAQAHAAWRSAVTALEQAQAEHARLTADAELTAVWLKELDELKYQADEEQALATRRSKLANLTQLQQLLAATATALEGDAEGSAAGALSPLGSATRSMAQAAGLDGSLAAYANRLSSAYEDVRDAAADIARLAEGGGEEGLTLEQVDDRLHALRAVARKHKIEVPELPALHAKLQQATLGMQSGTDALANLKKSVEITKNHLKSHADALSKARNDAKITLIPPLSAKITDLHMPHAVIDIQLTPQPEVTSYGAENITFLLAANPGSPLQPLHKVASGGELSRLTLALKTVMYQGVASRTIILDEIDSGLSGATAAAVAAAMRQLAQSHQVLSITHHAQVAAKAQHNWRISKQTANGATTTVVENLNESEMIDEVARLLSGAKITPEARAAAQALRAEQVTEIKKKKAA